MSNGVPLDAAALAGLLAEEDRRRVFAALVLGARDLDAVAAATELGVAQVGRALARLEAAGLVDRSPDGALALFEGAFAAAGASGGEEAGRQIGRRPAPE